MISYRPFWDTLTEKKISTYRLINYYGISSSLIDRLRNDGDVKMSSINKLCVILECGIMDIVEFEKEPGADV